MTLDIGLGLDKIGRLITHDLTGFPHLLVAGMSGSGKSTWVNHTLIDLIQHSTDEVRLLLIDPKRVELALYRGVEHLIAPPIVEPELADGWLAWLLNQMEMRFELLAAQQRRSVEGMDIPRIVVVVDELANLILEAPAAEKKLARLASMGRAAGIHLILATQRPDSTILTGLLRANIPGRIAFATLTANDSRIILDTTGAEELNRGELLVRLPGSRETLKLTCPPIPTEKIIEAASAAQG